MKRNFKAICLMLAVVVMAVAVPYAAIAIDETTIAVDETADFIVVDEFVCDDDCANHEHGDEEDEPTRNIFCYIFGHLWYIVGPGQLQHFINNSTYCWYEAWAYPNECYVEECTATTTTYGNYVYGPRHKIYVTEMSDGRRHYWCANCSYGYYS